MREHKHAQEYKCLNGHVKANRRHHQRVLQESKRLPPIMVRGVEEENRRRADRG